jgi:hypothetical protein
MEESLKSKQQWTAIDGQGNEIMKSFADPEIWDKPIFQYGMNSRCRPRTTILSITIV